MRSTRWLRARMAKCVFYHNRLCYPVGPARASPTTHARASPAGHAHASIAAHAGARAGPEWRGYCFCDGEPVRVFLPLTLLSE